MANIQTLIGNSSIFTKLSRTCKLSSSSCWIPLQGCSRKGLALDRITPWIAPSLFPQTSGTLVWPLLDTLRRLSSLQSNHHMPHSLKYMMAATP